jgi:hypothetical protein
MPVYAPSLWCVRRASGGARMVAGNPHRAARGLIRILQEIGSLLPVLAPAGTRYGL